MEEEKIKNYIKCEAIDVGLSEVIVLRPWTCMF